MPSLFQTISFILVGLSVAIEPLTEAEIESLFRDAKYNEIAARICPIDPQCLTEFAQLTAGPFPAVNPIGAGTFGAIYPLSDTKVVKVQTIHDAQHLASLVREVNVGVKAEFDNVNHLVRVQGCCIGARMNGAVEERKMFIRMARYSGDLRTFMATPQNRKHILNPAWKYSIAIDVIDGVLGLHKMGYIHRDLKPANILMNGAYEAAISDFGQVLAEHPTNLSENTQDITGTPGYIPPEGRIGFAAGRSNLVGKFYDIYSLGVIIFEVMNAGSYAIVDHKKVPEAIRNFCKREINPRSILDWEADFYCRHFHELILKMIDPSFLFRPTIEKVSEIFLESLEDFIRAQKELQRAKNILGAIDTESIDGSYLKHKGFDDMQINLI